MFGKPDLALAIIAKLAGFKHPIPPQCIHRMMQIGGTGDVPESGCFNAKIAGKSLFANPVLGGMQGGFARAGKAVLTQKGHCACGYIFKFTGDGINLAGKGGKRF